MTFVVCADVGSTYTKVSIVDTADGRLVATAAHRTTLSRPGIAQACPPGLGSCAWPRAG